MEEMRVPLHGRAARNAWCSGLVASALLLSLRPWAAAAQPAAPQAVTEYEAKAAFLYNFGLFVKWPERAFERTGNRFVVGVLGEDPFGGLLEETLQGEAVQERRVQVAHFANIDSVRDVHVLFVGAPHNGAVSRVTAALRGSAVLTVGESPGFAENGGMIGFRLQAGKIRLDVNVKSAEASGLKISSQILKLATIVSSGSN